MPNTKIDQPVETDHSPDTLIAIISDVHANARALESVFADIQSRNVDRIACLGDTVGYGDAAAECVRAVRESCLFSVLGNHEAMLIYGEPAFLEHIPEQVGRPLLDARNQLDNDAMEWLRDQTLIATMGSISFSHASRFQSEEFNYVFTPEEAALHFKNCEEEISFFGHTHAPCVWKESDQPSGKPTAYHAVYREMRLQPGRRYAINVGSVGKPRDGDSRPCYAIYNPATRILAFRRVGSPGQ